MAGINFDDFFTQYFLYPKTLGSGRLDWLFPLEFKRVIWRFKLQYLSIVVLVYLSIKYNLLKKNNFFF